VGKLEKKVAVITGAARGIGKQIALTFASEGADIVIGDIITMETAAQEIRSLGRKVVTVKVDVSSKQQVKNLFDTAIDNFKKVDILVNNAGIVRYASILDMSEEDWDIVLEVNLKGVFLCSQAVAGYMIQQKYGRIINIASIAGINSIPQGLTSYATSKAGVIQLTKVCAIELGPYGINVNAIAPGIVITDGLYAGRTQVETELFIKERVNLTVLDRVGTTQDIANSSLFLASDESSFITGQVIAVDGGRTGLK